MKVHQQKGVVHVYFVIKEFIGGKDIIQKTWKQYHSLFLTQFFNSLHGIRGWGEKEKNGMWDVGVAMME